MSALPVLTPRQSEVLALSCAGLTYAQIGARLGIAEQTVKNHVSAIVDRVLGDGHGAGSMRFACYLFGMARASGVLDPDGTAPLRPGDV